MSHEVIPCHRRPHGAKPESRSGHVSVAYGPCIYVWGGYHELQVARWTDERYLPCSEIWVFNTFTKEWKRQKCSGQYPRASSGSCAVVHGHFMYLFAGFTDTRANLNTLYKLDLKTFYWSRADGLSHPIDASDNEDTEDEEAAQIREKRHDPTALNSMPSRRDKLCGWTYENRLYFFGGFGPRLDGDPTYLKEDGVWVADNSPASQMLRGWNNQLVCFDLETKKWSSVSTRGPRPLPRAAMSSAIIGDRAFIFGGRHESTRRSDMNCVNMKTFEWTGELAPPPESPRPVGRSWSSLCAIDERHLFLFGGYDQSSTPLNDAFLFDVEDRRWIPLPQDSIPDLSKLPLTPTSAWTEHVQPRPATTKGLFWHTGVSLSCPNTAAASPGVYVFGGMLTPIGQTSSSTYHSSHLIHFAFKPKSLTLLALEHLAHKLADFTTQAANDTDTQSRHERALQWFGYCLPRPLTFSLNARVESLESIKRLEHEATRRPTQLPVPGFPQRPTDGAGGQLLAIGNDGQGDDDDDDDEDDYEGVLDDVMYESDDGEGSFESDPEDDA